MATGDKLVSLDDLKAVYDKQTANNAPVFSTLTEYAAGDYVVYNGALYRFTSAHAAGAWTGTDAVATQLSAEIVKQHTMELLKAEDIPDTVQTITFDSTTGNVSQIVHKKRTDNTVTVRTDVFTFTTNTITEVRTLGTGESLTIVTNTETLSTTITYAAA